MNPPRVGLPDAITRVLQALQEMSQSTISGLARATGLDRRTVAKVIEVLLQVQESMRGMELARVRSGRHYLIQLREQTERARQRFLSFRRRLWRSEE